jgi:hypothetical protein
MDLETATLQNIAEELKRRPVRFCLATIEETNWSAESGVYHSGTVGDALQLLANGSLWLRYVNGLP